MDVCKIMLFAQNAEGKELTIWEDANNRYEIVFSDGFISSLQSVRYETLQDSEFCRVLLLTDQDSIMSIGGFKAHNEGKRIAKERNLSLITVPTQLANDSFGTNRYSLTNVEKTASIESVFPVKTIFDLSFIESNGIEKSYWGIGEYVGLYYSALDYSMKTRQRFDKLASWIVDEIHELRSICRLGDNRSVLKRIAILLTAKCLVMRSNGCHEIGCGIDHSLARCFENQSSIPHGKAVYLGSLVASFLYPEWENHGLLTQEYQTMILSFYSRWI